MVAAARFRVYLFFRNALAKDVCCGRFSGELGSVNGGCCGGLVKNLKFSPGVFVFSLPCIILPAKVELLLYCWITAAEKGHPVTVLSLDEWIDTLLFVPL